VPDEDVSKRVRAFIADHVESVMQLELLLLLASRRDREWTAAQLAKEMRVDAGWLDARLAAMAGDGLLVARDGIPRRFRYGPRSRELDAAVEELALVYGQRRVTIVDLIFSGPHR
jgi:hypothetical protein